MTTAAIPQGSKRKGTCLHKYHSSQEEIHSAAARPARRPAWAHLLLLGWLALKMSGLPSQAADYFVSPQGRDDQPGTRDQPFASLKRAQQAARLAAGREPVTVFLRAGTYYLTEPVVFTPEDSGTREAPVKYQAWGEEPVVISGGTRLNGLKWEAWRDGILQAEVPAGLETDQLFVNGERQHMARYPNFNASERIYNGYAADAISPERVQRWADPRGGYLHAMHEAMWGGFHYRITGKDAGGKAVYEGGWQNNRPARMHARYRFVEKILEELDAPGEWFLDSPRHKLLFFPPVGLDLSAATIETVRLRRLFELRGTPQKPVRFLALKGLVLRHTARTFMDNREPLVRSDWTTYRGGTIFITGSEDCVVEDCFLDQVGGNAIFVNEYNRRLTVRGCHIAKAGANGVAFVGDRNAARVPRDWQDRSQSFATLDRTPGPKTDNYPADCLVEDCLIYLSGRVEKQTSPVQIELAEGITVRHCSLYQVPRAGINIGDGCWGGHVIEFCDIFDTVLETGDHGSFNSWGRDRFWNLSGLDLNDDRTWEREKETPLLDARKTVILRNNRWRCDHGWDIDLDDGSTNYRIYNNLCLNGGLKNREGFYRVVENNIIVNNGFHPHVWYKHSQDIVRRNLMLTDHYLPAGGMPSTPWGGEMDYNLVHRPGVNPPQPAARLAQQSQRDAHSVIADAGFINPAQGDFRVREDSPALKLGFVNFPMDQFGVRKPALKAIARTPQIPTLVIPGAEADRPARPRRNHLWQAQVRNITGLGDRSAYGLPDESGVLLVNVPAGTPAAKAGLRKDDVILACQGKPVRTVQDVLARQSAAAGSKLSLEVRRQQQNVTLEVADYAYFITELRDDAAFTTIPMLPSAAVLPVKASASEPATVNEPLATLADGQLARNYGPVFPNGISGGLYKLDLGSVKNIARVNSFSFNEGGGRGRQRFSLYGSQADSDPGWNVEDSRSFTPIGEVDMADAPKTGFAATSLRRSGGQALGAFRWLVWRVLPVTTAGGGENTSFQEFQVIPQPAGPRSWNRTGPLGETPSRANDAYPLSDQSNRAGWRKFEPMWDEFEGPALNTNRWQLNMSWWKGRQPALFSEHNVTVSNRQLHLTMRQATLPESAARQGYTNYTSAALHTRARTAYGYFEVRARPMNSAGSSSFWFQQDEAPGWGTEIDVFEIGGKAKGFERKYNMNAHVFRTPTETRHWSAGGEWLAPWPLAADYHVYGLEWDAKELKYFVDGVLVRTVENTHWHQPLYLIFDSETMPGWFGMPEDADLPSTFSIDYVHAWKKEGNLVANGGFENGLADWRPFWSRQAGAGSAVIDQAETHSGTAAARIDHRGHDDWALEPNLRLPVQSGQEFELAAWIRLQGAGSATLCVSTWGQDGRNLDWSYAERTTAATPDWVRLQTRFYIPPGVSQIQPRLIGYEAAKVWVDDVSLVQQVGLKLERPPDLPAQLAQTNEFLELRVQTAEGTWSVLDRRSGRLWGQAAAQKELVVAGGRTRNGEIELDLIHLTSGLKLRAVLQLDPMRPELTVRLAAEGEMRTPLKYPHPFASEPGDRLVVPMNEGISYPVEDRSVEPFRLIAYGGHGICMAFWGVTGDRPGYSAIIETPDDAAIRIQRLADRLAIAPEWDPQKGRFGYARRLRYVFHDGGGHVAIAKRYREHARQNGLLKTLAEKRKENPEVDLLIGAANIWNWDADPAALVREMKEAGLERILWSRGGSPEAVRALNDLQVLTSRYDIYQDVMDPANFPFLHGIHGDWTTAAWPQDLIRRQDGSWQHGWGVQGKKGEWFYCGVTCDRQALAYARQRIPADLASRPYKCRFIDTTTASPWNECWHTNHPLTRSESREWKMKLLDYVSKDMKLVTGCETGHDAAVPFLHYFEGMLSLGPYRVPDAGRDMQRIWTEVPEPVAKFQLGQAYRLPLWELVYHDCVVAQWYWGDYNNKLPALWEKRDLFNLLYGTPPMYMFNRKLWQAERGHFARSYQNICPAVRATGYAEMTNHLFLTPDRNVQQSTFANGVTVTVNFGASAYQLASGESVPPMGFRVAGMPR